MTQDNERLPEGFSRTGYDADSERYTFLGPDNQHYESEPGNRYGKLWPAGEHQAKLQAASDLARQSSTSSTRVKPGDSPTTRQRGLSIFDEIEADQAALKKDNKEAVRTMLPFALLILVAMILLFKLLYRSGADSADHGHKQIVHCRQGSHEVQVLKGDTCWAIAESYGMGVDEFLGLYGNEALDCDRLSIGQKICLLAADE